MDVKTIWNSKYPELYEFYCPLCKTERRLPFQPKPQARHVVQVALTAIVLMIATWPLFGAKGAVIFVPLWIAFETFYRLRLRSKLPCEQCGFDPYLFLLDFKRARAEVETHWRKKYAEKGIPWPEKQK